MPATTRSASKRKRDGCETLETGSAPRKTIGKHTARSAAAGPASSAAKESAHAPRSFWRTVSTARPSTGGPGSDPKRAHKIMAEWEAKMKAAGIVNGRSYGHWKDGRVGGKWVRVDPKTKQPVE